MNRRIKDAVDQESSDEYALLDPKGAEEILEEIEDVVSRAEHLEDTKDPKLEALQNVIRDKQRLKNNKLMVFSSFRHTLNYLFSKLSESDIRIGIIHGGTHDEDRIALREKFRKPREDINAIDVLLFSEVGCEGLDYQFCDCIVNYDLPWNPMRIEQRIGRIDRHGQKSEKVLIYNLITPGTVDADIHDRCLLRIGIFNREIGASEEILGEIARGIRSVAEDVQLSDAERKEKLQQLADNQIRLISEQQELEDKEAELFGIRLPNNQTQKDIENASSYWLSTEALQNLVEIYLREIAGKAQDFILGEKATKTIRAAQEVRAKLLKDYRKLPRIASPTHKRWENWLKGANPHLAITFDPKEAMENQRTTFITPLHPFTKQAARAMESQTEKPVCVIQSSDVNLPVGQYPFTIYEWRYSGVRNDAALHPVAQSAEVTSRLSNLMEFGRPGSLPRDQIPDQTMFDQLDTTHYQMWADARSKHKEENQRIAEHRKESLKTSHCARVRILKDLMSQATNERIHRMRQGELKNAETDYQRRLADLNSAVRKADLNAEPVAYGVAIVTREQKYD